MLVLDARELKCSLFSDFSRINNDNFLGRGTTLAANSFHCLDNIHAFNNLAKYDVLACGKKVCVCGGGGLCMLMSVHNIKIFRTPIFRTPTVKPGSLHSAEEELGTISVGSTPKNMF